MSKVIKRVKKLKSKQNLIIDTRYVNIRKASLRLNNIQKHSEYKLNKNWAFVLKAVRPNNRQTIRKSSAIGVGMYYFTSLSFMTTQRNRYTKATQIRITKKCLAWDLRRLYFKKTINMNTRFGKAKCGGFIRIA